MQPILEKGNQQNPEPLTEPKKLATYKFTGNQKVMARGLHKKKSSMLYKKSTEAMNLNQELKYFSEKKKSSPSRHFNNERYK